MIFIDLLVDDGYFLMGSKYLENISSIRIMNNEMTKISNNRFMKQLDIFIRITMESWNETE
jgi:hypothetical protein